MAIEMPDDFPARRVDPPAQKAEQLSLQKGTIMAILSNPFVMEVPRKLTDEELVNAIRQDLVGELEAIHEYDAHVQATDNEDAKKVLSDIRDEEREHMGELLELLERLAPDEKGFHDEGRGEVREMLDKKKK